MPPDADIGFRAGCEQQFGQLVAAELKAIVERQAAAGIADIEVRTAFDKKPQRFDLILRHGQVDETHGESVARPEEVLIQIRWGVHKLGSLIEDCVNGFEIAGADGDEEVCASVVRGFHKELQFTPTGVGCQRSGALLSTAND
jgi:hypothetical protein